MLSKKRGRKYKLFRASLFAAKQEARILYNKHYGAGKLHSHDTLRYNCTIAVSRFTILTYNQVEACRKVIARRIRKFKPSASYYMPLEFTLPITVKSKNSRMGKGKGKFSIFVARVKAMEPVFVLRNVTSGCAAGLANKIRHKLPVALRVYRNAFTKQPA